MQLAKLELFCARIRLCSLSRSCGEGVGYIPVPLAIYLFYVGSRSYIGVRFFSAKRPQFYLRSPDAPRCQSENLCTEVFQFPPCQSRYFFSALSHIPSHPPLSPSLADNKHATQHPTLHTLAPPSLTARAMSHSHSRPLQNPPQAPHAPHPSHSCSL
ncbi:hypothetical protein BJ546DRAFT_585488 [Cryomyces antarcticus]